MTEKIKLLPYPSNYLRITVILDDEDYVVSWGTSMSSIGTSKEVNLILVDTHPFFNGDRTFSYKYENNELVYVPDKFIILTKQRQLQDLDVSCNLSILAGFTYEYKGTSYQVSYSKNKQQRFEEFARIFSMSDATTVEWEFILDGNLVYHPLTKLEFLTLSTYATLIKQNKIDKLNKELTDLVNQATTVEEIQAIQWDSIPDYPNPEKPVIDLDGDGVVSQEEYDALLKENKQLYQRVDFNEQALLDAISMLSGMIMEQ